MLTLQLMLVFEIMGSSKHECRDKLLYPYDERFNDFDNQ